jgi:alpha-beta hydrolase superfamily lysophospholipase
MKKYRQISGTFIGKGGVELYFQKWTKEKPSGILVIIHGVGEHSGRYRNIIRELEKKSISIYSFDLRGHGRSGGKRGHIDSFMDYIEDIRIFIKLIRGEHEKLPILMLGHSMGGLIALKYLLEHPKDLRGLILSSPYLKLAVKVPGWKSFPGRLLSGVVPGLSMPTGLDPGELSSDKEVVDAYINDPLVHSLVSARWFTETTAAREECMVRGNELKIPALIFHGKKDNIVDCRGTEEFYKNCNPKHCTLHLFDALKHETMNETEPEREKVLKMVSDWIGKKIIKKK